MSALVLPCSPASPLHLTTDTRIQQNPVWEKLTQESLDVFWAAVVGPVSVLQVPHRPLLAGQQVLDL